MNRDIKRGLLRIESEVRGRQSAVRYAISAVPCGSEDEADEEMRYGR